MNRTYFILMSIGCMFYIIRDVRKKNFSVKESFLWVLAASFMLFLSIFPYSIDYFAKLLNIDYPPSLLFLICIIFLILINFKNSKKIADQQMKIIELAQELSILKEMNKLNRKKTK